MKQAFVNLLGIAIATAGLYASVIMATSSPEVSEPTDDRAWKKALTPIEHLALTGMENIETMSDSQIDQIIEHAMDCESAVIFCHADWNCSSQIGRVDFARLAASYHEKHPDQKIGFHYLDFTNAKRPPRNPHVEISVSTLLWLRDGKVVKSDWYYPTDKSIDNMVETTRHLTTPDTTTH